MYTLTLQAHCLVPTASSVIIIILSCVLLELLPGIMECYEVTMKLSTMFVQLLMQHYIVPIATKLDGKDLL